MAAPAIAHALRAGADSGPAYGPRVEELGLLAELVGGLGAARLVERFGGLRAIALASDVELREAGLTALMLRRLRAAFELGLRTAGASASGGVRLGSGAEVGRYFGARLALTEVEEFWALALNARHRIVAEFMVSRGSLTGVEVHPRDAFKMLIRVGAAAAIFCHNHPSGDPSPSRQDIELTGRLREVGELCGITVLDHVVVAGPLWTSIAERGWL